jgi:hypothetical protein
MVVRSCWIDGCNMADNRTMHTCMLVLVLNSLSKLLGVERQRLILHQTNVGLYMILRSKLSPVCQPALENNPIAR